MPYICMMRLPSSMKMRTVLFQELYSKNTTVQTHGRSHGYHDNTIVNISVEIHLEDKFISQHSRKDADIFYFIQRISVY